MVRHDNKCVRPDIRKTPVELECKCESEFMTVQADEEMIEQVLINLLDNAVKYTGENGRIIIRAGLEAKFLKIDIEDTGQGIQAEHLDRIFERFYRVDTSRSRATGGTGIGLAVVKGLVEAHGGRVWAESTPGQGSAFHFTMPAAIQS